MRSETYKSKFPFFIAADRGFSSTSSAAVVTKLRELVREVWRKLVRKWMVLFLEIEDVTRFELANLSETIFSFWAVTR